MNGLLANPVISGLLGGGPNAIRAAAEQQRMALAPRGGGGMSGAPGAIVTQDRSGADLGAGLAGLGQGLSAIGKMREKAKQREAFEATIASLPPEQQAIARLNPDAFAKANAEAMFRAKESNKPVALGQGQILVNPETGEQIAAGLPKPETLDLKGSAETGFYTVERGPDGKPVVSMVISPRSEPMTSLQKDFGFARKDGYKGSFTDFVRETRSTAIERAPQGYERTPDGMRPIAGGPADPATIAATEAAKKQAVAETEKRTLFPKAQSALKSLEMNSQLVLDAIDKADKDIGWNTTGVAGALLKNWPASDAYDLRQTIDTIRANIGFAELAQMRENSPTGGALGAVSENENRLLQAVKGSLDPNQSSEQLRENLATIRKNYEAVLAERRKAFRQDYGGMLPKEEEETPPPKAERDPETPPEGVTIDEWKFMTQEERALFK